MSNGLDEADEAKIRGRRLKTGKIMRFDGVAASRRWWSQAFLTERCIFTYEIVYSVEVFVHVEVFVTLKCLLNYHASHVKYETKSGLLGYTARLDCLSYQSPHCCRSYEPTIYMLTYIYSYIGIYTYWGTWIIRRVYNWSAESQFCVSYTNPPWILLRFFSLSHSGHSCWEKAAEYNYGTGRMAAMFIRRVRSQVYLANAVTVCYAASWQWVILMFYVCVS